MEENFCKGRNPVFLDYYAVAFIGIQQYVWKLVPERCSVVFGTVHQGLLCSEILFYVEVRKHS